MLSACPSSFQPRAGQGYANGACGELGSRPWQWCQTTPKVQEAPASKVAAGWDERIMKERRETESMWQCAVLLSALLTWTSGAKVGGKGGLRSGKRSLQGGVSQGRTHLRGSTQVLTEHAVGAEAAGRKVRGTRLQAPSRKLVQAEQVTVGVAEATKQGKGQAERPPVEVRAQVIPGSKMCM